MSIFKFLWLRRMIRRHTTPIPYRKAIQWRQGLSFVYAFVTWNMFGYLIYQYSKGEIKKKPSDAETAEFDMLSASHQFAINAGMKTAKIVRSKNNFEVEEFHLEDFEHLVKKPTAETKPEEDEDDEDNVA